jgi:hypothetical protein
VTALVPASPSPAALPARADHSATVLSKSEANLEAPVAELADYRRRLGRYFGHDTKDPITDKWAAARFLEIAPPRALLQELWNKAAPLFSQEPRPEVNAILLGLMLDSFPNRGKETRETYFATLDHEVARDGFSPSVVAVATRNLRRSSRFVPTVSEVLEACEAVQTEIVVTFNLADMGLRRLNEADAFLKAQEEGRD